MAAPPQQRSHRGCMTCKQRRRKCDEERPACRNCRESARECLGYQVNLKWDVGIASRGKFQGMNTPQKNLAVNTPKGRLRDRRKSLRIAENQQAAGSIADENTLSSPSPTAPGHSDTGSSRDFALQQGTLYQEFLETGHMALYFGETPGSPLQETLFTFSDRSYALFLACIAVQAHLSGLAEEDILRHHSEALVHYQRELEYQVQPAVVGTMTAGALLCTFGILHDMPWTIHLKGLSSLFAFYWEVQLTRRLDPFLIHIIEVLAVMDMPTFVIGRRSPCLRLWQTYRQGRLPDEQRTYDDGDVEGTSGVPRSLLDLIAGVGTENAQTEIWRWRGHVGTFERCHLWEAYRFAAIVRAEGPHWTESLRDASNATLELAICRLMASLDALFTGLDLPQSHHLLASNSILYPLFVAGVATMISPTFQRWGPLVQGWFERSSREQPRGNTRIVKAFLDSCRSILDSDSLAALDMESMAMERSIEIALF